MSCLFFFPFPLYKCSLAVSRHNDSPCHWIKTSQARRVGLALCTGLLTIKLSRTGQFCNSSENSLLPEKETPQNSFGSDDKTDFQWPHCSRLCASGLGVQSHIRVHRWVVEHKRHHRIRWTTTIYKCYSLGKKNWDIFIIIVMDVLEKIILFRNPITPTNNT